MPQTLPQSEIEPPDRSRAAGARAGSTPRRPAPRFGPRKRRALAVASSDVATLAFAFAFAVSVSALAAHRPLASVAWTAAYVLLVVVIILLRGSYCTRLQAPGANDAFAAEQTIRLWGFTGVYLFAGRLGVQRRDLLRAPPRTRNAHPMGRHGGPIRGMAPHRPPRDGAAPRRVPRTRVLESSPRACRLCWEEPRLEEVVREHGVEQLLATFSTSPTPVVFEAHPTRPRARSGGGARSAVLRGGPPAALVEHLGGIALPRVNNVDFRGPRGARSHQLPGTDRAVVEDGGAG